MIAYPIMVLYVAVGMAGFALIVPRILARRSVAKPALSGKFDAGRYCACAVYIVIYIFMIVQPLIGCAIVNAKGMAIHVPLACILYGLLAIHVSAALWHHFVKRDNTLRNMMSVIGSRG